jgi:hypothetical protein
MEKCLREYLTLVAVKYAKKNSLALTTVARYFHGKESFFDEWENGKCSITLRKFDEMLEAFKQQWPESNKWPEPKFSKKVVNGYKKLDR